jgi:Viral coat protein P2 N-terminal domain
MRHIFDEITGFNGGGFSSQFTLNMDVGPTYKEIVLDTNLDNDQLVQIMVTLNGDTIVDLSGEQLRMLEAYKDRFQQDGKFVIPFADMSAKTQDGQNLTELVTLEGDNLTLTVKTGAATAGQVSSSLVPTLMGEAVMSSGVDANGVKRKRVIIPRLYSELVQAGSTGRNVYKNFNRGPRIRRLHFESNVVSNLEIKRDKLVRVDISADMNSYLLKREGLVPQANHFHFDPLMYKFAKSDFLQTAGQSFEINPTVTSVGDLPVIFETVETV